MKICAKKVSTNFITDIVIKNNKDSIEGYEIASDINLNEGISDEAIYVFYSRDIRPGLIIDNAFVWGQNNKLYFFKDNMYWKFDDEYKLEENFPQEISSRWGNLPDNIDAVFTNPNDNKTYFFNGSLYYEYDNDNLKIKDGYPKKIKDYWNGIPENNIDAVFVSKDKEIYFIKDKWLFWNNNDETSAIAETFNNTPRKDFAPTNISSMFYYKDKVYITQSNKVYSYNPDTKKLDKHFPKNINTVFSGVIKK